MCATPFLLDGYFACLAQDYLLALGRGSIFNHSSEPNLTYQTDAAQGLVRYITLRDIAAGEELCFFYNPTEKLKFKPAAE